MQKRIWFTICAIIAIAFICVVIILNYPKAPTPFSTVENVQKTAWTNLFGIDISHYQGIINWEELNTSEHQVKYIFIRATMGKDGQDFMFADNWKKAKKHQYIRGAYHYYRPNENSDKQFSNFQNIVKLNQGDFVPILDIEEESIYGRDNLRRGVQNWLKLAEKHYGVKPMIYTGLHFYQHVLHGHVDGYPLWIASYTGRRRIHEVDWTFHQFSDKIKIKGIKHHVDGNNFNGNHEDLQQMLK